MKKTELPNCPQWLLDADTENENVEWFTDKDSWIIWRSGVWHGGDWRSGDWRSGDWRSGVWRSGVWHGGVWRSGDWRSGDWRSGVWRNGDWRNGDWRSGDWHGGVWRSGVWRSGANTIRAKWLCIAQKDGTISIGCKNKTRKAWAAWFKGKEVFSTARDTWEFRSIYGSYLGLCAWLDATAEPKPKKKRT